MVEMNYCIVAKSRLDIWFFRKDRWKYYWEIDQQVGTWIKPKMKLIDICKRTMNISRSEFKRKLKEGAIDYSWGICEPKTLRSDIFIRAEGMHTIKFGKRRYLGIVVPEPWYIALWLEFAALWDKTVLRKIKLL